MPSNNYVFTPAKQLLGNGGADWDAASPKYYALFLASGASSLLDAATGNEGTVAAIPTAIGNYEFNGSGYTQGGIELVSASRGVSSATNGKAFLTAGNVSISAMGAGTGSGANICEVLIYQGTAGGASYTAGVPVARLQLSATYTGAGASFTLNWSPNGILQLN